MKTKYIALLLTCIVLVMSSFTPEKVTEKGNTVQIDETDYQELVESFNSMKNIHVRVEYPGCGGGITPTITELGTGWIQVVCDLPQTTDTKCYQYSPAGGGTWRQVSCGGPAS